MTRTILTSLLFVLTINSFSQTKADKTDFNFGFEKVTPGQKLPDGWIEGSVRAKGYNYRIDSLIKHSGRNSLVIEHSGPIEPTNFGLVRSQIPSDFTGKEIELRANFKLEKVSKGPISLWLRLDGDSLETIGNTSTKQKNVQGTSDWTLYTVKLPFSNKVRKINVGAFLYGTGQIWVDDFQLLIDGKDISKAKRREIFKAELDHEFDNGSRIGPIYLNDEKTNDLKLLGMVWGVLKYYHPNVAAGNYNWDYELFRILPLILEAGGSIHRDRILTDWIKGLGLFKETGNSQRWKGEIIWTGLPVQI
jgi:hypothetical protein